jgi:hypothetical protein
LTTSGRWVLAAFLLLAGGCGASLKVIQAPPRSIGAASIAVFPHLGSVLIPIPEGMDRAAVRDALEKAILERLSEQKAFPSVTARGTADLALVASVTDIEHSRVWVQVDLIDLRNQSQVALLKLYQRNQSGSTDADHVRAAIADIAEKLADYLADHR